MTRRRSGFALVLLAAGTGLAVAQSGGSYRITKHVVAGGGGTAAGGTYAVAATVGQSVAGAQQGGAYTLDGGFHAKAAPPPGGDALFQNGFE